MPVRIAVLGQALPALLAGPASFSTRIEVIARAQDTLDLKRRLGDHAPDILIVECPTVQPQSGRRIHELMTEAHASGCIVVYGFGNREDVRALRCGQVAAVRAPVPFDELQHLALGLGYSGGDACISHARRQTSRGRRGDGGGPVSRP